MDEIVSAIDACTKQMTFEKAIEHIIELNEEIRYDFCYECRGNGNDYYLDDNGDLVSACEDCPFNDWSDTE